jgi:hypothetical protein
MATRGREKTNSAEYRRLYIAPQQSGNDPEAWKDQSPAFADDLTAAVEKLDLALEDGWQLVSIGVERDAKNRQWLSATLKKAAVCETAQTVVMADTPPLSIFRAA